MHRKVFLIDFSRNWWGEKSRVREFEQCSSELFDLLQISCVCDLVMAGWNLQSKMQQWGRNVSWIHIFLSCISFNFGSCCLLPCQFQMAKVITINEAGEGSVDPEGLANSFLISVDNDTQWVPVLHESTSKCANQFLESSTEYFCEGFTENLLTFFSCYFLSTF